MAITNSNMTAYLSELDASEEVLDRVELFLEISGGLLPSVDFTNIFITDALNEDGVRSFINLWLWDSNYMVEAHNFMFAEILDSALIGKITRWEVESQAYIPGQETAETRMTVTWTNAHKIRGTLTGTGNNCKFLTNFIRDAIAPHHI